MTNEQEVTIELMKARTSIERLQATIDNLGEQVSRRDNRIIALTNEVSRIGMELFNKSNMEVSYVSMKDYEQLEAKCMELLRVAREERDTVKLELFQYKIEKGG